MTRHTARTGAKSQGNNSDSYYKNLTIDTEGNDLGEASPHVVVGLAQVAAFVATLGTTHEQSAVLEAGHAPFPGRDAGEFSGGCGRGETARKSVGVIEPFIINLEREKIYTW